MVNNFRPRIGAVLAIAAVAAMVVMIPGMGNGFAYDDIPIIVQNDGLHSLTTLPGRLFEPYWLGTLYRPLTMGMFGLEWLAGGGSPLPFHLTSLVLYSLLAAGVALLASHLGASPWAALLGGVVFAVHPVHSEVTANIVGQAELLSAVMVTATMLVYLRARVRGGPSPWETAALLLGVVLASQAKESGYAVAGLLVAAEFLVIPTLVRGQPDRDRLRLPVLLMIATVAGAIALRVSVLGGIGGETPHLSWQGMPTGTRVQAMLGVVPEWTRLLFWPARLQAEYGPPELTPTGTMAIGHLVGLGLLVATLALLIWARRRAPMLAFGLAWVVIALAPVSNILFPTGIILAERTLFLPSIGVSLMVAWGAGMAAIHLSARARAVLSVGAAAVLLAAGVKSAMRQPAWRDTDTILSQTVQDAPRSYRAHLVLGKALLQQGDRGAAMESFAEAGRLWAHDPRPFEELGQLLRSEGNCAEAIGVLRRAVEADSTSDVARGRLVECLIVEQRWDEAEAEVERGLGQGVVAYQGAVARIETGRRGTPIPPP